MSNYTITTDFGAKDSLPSSNDSKVVRGSEFTTEFTNIQTAIATKADTAGDTFTGVVNFSADVAVNTNTLFVDVSADKVGIGTTTPDKKLHVSGGDVRIESTFPRLYLTDTNNNSDYSIINNNGQFGIYDDTNATYRMVIANTSGNVGIGNNDPQQKLDVTGQIKADDAVLIQGTGYARLEVGGGTGAYIDLKTPDSDDYDLRMMHDSEGSKFISPNADVKFDIGGQLRTIIKSDGKVGIGTNAPDAKLDVVGDIASTGAITSNGIVSIESGTPRLRFKETDIAGNNFEFRNSGGNFIGRTSSDDFATQQNRMVLKSNGDVLFYEETGTTAKLFWDASAESLGIGTDSPSNPLHIKATTNTPLSLETTHSGGNSRLEFKNENYRKSMGVNSDGNFSVFDITNNKTPFLIANDVASHTLVLNGSNVGIGTDNPIRALHVNSGNDTIRLQSTSTNTKIEMVNTGSTTNEFGFLSNNFFVSPDGAEALRIDSSGNVGIGTTSPTFGAISKGLEIEDTTAGIRLQGATTGAFEIYHNNGTSTLDSRPAAGGIAKIAFKTEGSERMRIDSSGHVIIPEGITLGTATGTNVTATTLDDYEEGTWTMSVRDSESTPNVSSSTNSNCRYIKVGNQVTIEGLLLDINKGSLGSSGLKITGFPFTIKSTGSTRPHGAIQVNNITGVQVDRGLYVQGQANGTHALLKSNVTGAGATTLNASALDSGNTSDIFFSLTYIAE